MYVRNSLFILLSVLSLMNHAVAFESPMLPQENELAQTRQWAASWFEGIPQPVPLSAKLEVEAEKSGIVHGRNGHKMLANRMWQDLPLKIADELFYSGLYTHANSRVKVTLPGKGDRFRALIGIDSTDVTKAGQGSAVFAVYVGEKCLYRSEVLRGGMKPVPVLIELGGAKEFFLELSDGGDGIYCDCGNWADAGVVMADGRKIMLGGPLTGPVSSTPPFSFTYGGKESTQLLATWPVKRTKRKVDAGRIAHTIVWTDPKTALQVRCEGIEYVNFPTIEWIVYFKNTGDTDTPLLTKIMGADLTLQRGLAGEFTLHHQIGSPATIDDYAPREEILKPGTSKQLGTYGGRPLNVSMPYFNVHWHGAGAIVAIGWPGQWVADFVRDGPTGLQVRGGQELTNLKLLAGEEIRSSLTVVQFYQGETVRAQNVWRRWMMEHNVPRPGGEMLSPKFSAASSAQFAEMMMANEENQKRFIDRYLEEGTKIDYWWMDFGWYYYRPPNIRYEADLERFPNGLRAITDHGRSRGVKSIVWFEPENVSPESKIYEEHPEWILDSGPGVKLVDLGNPQAWQWMVDMVDGQLIKEGIDLYRHDFNMEPLKLWRDADQPDRQGITENKYISGYLAFWDELQRRHPKMLIDSCSSGGKRNEMEAMRRAVPLWRTDYNNTGYVVFNYRIAPKAELSRALQCHTYGLARWIPYFGTALRDDDLYIFRSAITPSLTCNWNLDNPELDYDLLRQCYQEWRSTSKYMLGDYYPLTSYSRAADAWMAWQFDRPDLEEGMLQAFRRLESVICVCQFPLRGLEPDAQYDLVNFDVSGKTRLTGRDLMGKGLMVNIPDQPGAVVITYKKVK